MVIRPATVADANDIYRMLVQFATSYIPRVDAFSLNFPQLLENSDVVLLVAIDGDKAVGYALGIRLPTLYANGSILVIQELFVEPDRRNRRIGRALIEAAVERARSMGCVEATVPTRRAKDYYVKLGFTETAVYLKLKLSVSAESTHPTG